MKLETTKVYYLCCGDELIGVNALSDGVHSHSTRYIEKALKRASNGRTIKAYLTKRFNPLQLLLDATK